MDHRLILCSKSAWNPPTRREHALAVLAAAHGHAVTFVERPVDIRSLRVHGAGRWLVELLGRDAGSPLTGVALVRRTAPAPGHHDALAQAVETVLLGCVLRGLDTADATIVATAPWQWPALTRAPARRRVFDCADDWSRLLPHRREAMRALHRRIAAEADAVIVAAEPLSALFAPAPVVEVRNGANGLLLSTALTPSPSAQKMAYAGTLSERLDVELLAAALDALPGWQLDLYGERRYARGRAAELDGLLHRFSERVTWHGAVAREELTACLDAAAVLVLPHRARGAVTGDAMKLYDYAARGRPIVSTRWSRRLASAGPPHLYLAAGADEFAAAVQKARHEPRAYARERRMWAEERRWESRWPAWSEAMFGR